MKVGLYFGTFNPIHVGHMIIANYMADHTDLDGDDRGSNIGLCAENPNDMGQFACDEWVFSGSRWSEGTGDPNPPGDGF